MVLKVRTYVIIWEESVEIKEKMVQDYRSPKEPHIKRSGREKD